MKYYVLDENKNLIEALDKEGVEALLAQAIKEGRLPSVDEDTAFVTMLKDPHTGKTNKVAFVNQAQYNQLVADGDLIPNCYYFITDDATADDLEAHITANDGRMSALEEDYAQYKQELRDAVGELEEDYAQYKQELHDVVGDLAWNKVGSNVSEFDLVSGKTYFVVIKGEEGHASPSFDPTLKYYGAFVISNFSRSYETIGGIIQHDVKSGHYYGISVGGKLEEKDETEIVQASSNFSTGISVKLTASIDKMDVYILN